MTDIKKFLSSIQPYGCYITSDVTEMRWLTGRVFEITEKNFLLVRRDSRAEAQRRLGGGFTVFCARIAYDSVKRGLPGAEIVLSEVKDNNVVTAAEYIKKNKISGAAFDKNKEFFAAGEILKNAGVAPAAAVTAAARAVKTPSEIKFISRACNIAYRAYKYVKPRLKTGMTERQVAAMLEDFMAKAGAEKTSFETIVGFGKNSADIHHFPGDTKLKENDAVLMDFGCVIDGYCSDITRSWWRGKNAPAEYKKIWATAAAAQNAALKKIKPGTSAKAADKIARDIISAAGYGDMPHTLGHGVGINIHEAPMLSPRAAETDILRAGNVFTIEPGIYLPGKFGVRHEETVLLEKSGVKILTK